MVAPGRKLRGPWLVAAIIGVALLFAIPVLLFRPQSVLGPVVLFLRADGTITANRTDVPLPADFGPHCSRIYVDPRGFLAAEAGVDLANVDAILLQHIAPESGVFTDSGGDRVRSLLRVVDGAWVLRSPIDNRTLATFTRDGANVTVDSVTSGVTVHAPGSMWEDRFEYDVTTPAGLVRIAEAIEFSNLGFTRPHIVPVAACA